MNRLIDRFWGIKQAGSSVRQELVAGLTTFFTMAYIIVVNPKILEAAGIPFGPSMVATILTASLGTFLMAVYARRPFAIAPYMGENAFVAFTVVKMMGYTWQDALGATFLSALVFALLTVLKVRSWLVDSIPFSLKIAFSVGIGLFLSFIGLNESGLVQLGVPGAPVHVGHLNEPTVQLAVCGLVLTSILMIRKVPGALMLGILGTTGLGLLLGHVTPPAVWLSPPPDITPILGQLDLTHCLSVGFFPVLLTMFVIIFVDTMGTLIGLSYRGGFLDEKGHLPDIEKPMLCDSVATMAGAWMGTTTAGAYIESAAGVEAGGRTGLTALVVSLLFLVALFLSPILTIVPAFAYGPVLVLIGLQMLAPVQKLDFSDLSEVIPVGAIMLLMSFTYNLGIGMTAGFVLYPLLKLAAGQSKAITPGLWALAALSALFFVFYPY